MRQPGSSSRRRRILVRVMALGMMLVVSVVAIEIVLQAYYYFKTGGFLFARFAEPFYAPNDACAYRLRPNLSVRHTAPEFSYRLVTNSQGFRVGDQSLVFEVPKPADVYRVMLLGPSFAMGWGVDYDKSLGAVIERGLNEAGVGGGKRVELINAGVPALPPPEQLAWFKAQGHEYDPDLVIQIVYGTLTVDPSPVLDMRVTDDGYIVRRHVPLGKRAVQFAKKSALVFYGFVAVTNLREMISPGKQGSGAIDGAGQAMSEETAFDPDEAKIRAALRYYTDFKDEMESVGTRFCILHFPLSYCVHPQDMSRWKHLGVQDPRAQIEFNRAFGKYLDSIGIPCINVTQELVDAANRTTDRLYYWLDVHFTELGNEVAGEATVARLLADPADTGATP